MTSVDVKSEKFQCRRCRHVLFEWNDLTCDHDVKENCSLWFLKDDEMLPWVQRLVDEGNWTKGKLYCPQCEARVGAFDFLHVITCECCEENIPSVYCVKSKVDHMKKFTQQQWSVVTHSHVDNINAKHDLEKNNAGGEQLNEEAKSCRENSSTGSDVELKELIEMEDFNDESKEVSLLTSCTERNNASDGESLHNTSLDNYEILDSLQDDRDEVLSYGDSEVIDEYKIDDPNMGGAPNMADDPNMEDFFLKMIVSDALSIEDSVEEVRENILFDSAFMKDGSSQTRVSETGDEVLNVASSFGRSDDEASSIDEDIFITKLQDVNSAQCNCSTDPFIGNFCELNKTTTVFSNPIFDPDSSGDHLNFLKESPAQYACTTETKCHVPQYTSHRPIPHTLRCLQCRASYDRFVQKADQRRKKKSNCCEPQRLERFNEFVNISYDGNKREGYIHTASSPCPCCREHDHGITSRTYGTPTRACGCMNIEKREIYDDLMSVRQDMINLQGLIETTSEHQACVKRRHKRECRRRRLDERLNNESNCHDDEEYEDNISVSNEGSEFQIPDSFQCPVCLDILYEPHATECAHIFCSPCLRQLNKTSNRKPLCPLCRQNIRQVEHCHDLQDDIKRLYPEVHRQRSIGETRRPLNQFPLPSPTSVRFERPRSDLSNRFMHLLQVARTCLLVVFMLMTYLLNGEGRGVEQRRHARHLRVFFYIVIGLVFTFCGIVIGLLCAFYTYDLLKFLVGLVLFYTVVAKYVMAYTND